MKHKNSFLTLYISILFCCVFVYSEPIVINGAMVPPIVGKSIKSLRVLNNSGKVIPFQIDEITKDDEYICYEGKEPNSSSSNGILDLKDEIVFLLEDCESGEAVFLKNANSVYISKNGKIYKVFIIEDSTLQLSEEKYIEYDHESRILKTPYFYAQFGKDRFHFERAGVTTKNSRSYYDLTSELSVEIKMKALFGLIPIHFTENNLICFVKRWKVGAIRLIRRGDFHLNLGLGLKGSRASINQICYPQIVKVPVLIHIPFRFGSLFKDACIEMAPVIKKDSESYHFSINEYNLNWKLNANEPKKDTIFSVLPCNTLMSVNNGFSGYGWILQTTIPEKSLVGSGILFRKPSGRQGIADCGYHLSVDNVDKGYYDITNWVIFTDVKEKNFSVDYQFISVPSKITTIKGVFDNLVCSIISSYKNKKMK